MHQATETAEGRVGTLATEYRGVTARRILVLGDVGSGKTALIWTLPGRKLVYVFDPNTMSTLAGCPNCSVVEFYPEFAELDATLKGFNVNPKTGKQYPGDKPTVAKEPTVYTRWTKHISSVIDGGLLKQYDWLCFDSVTFLAKAMMDRQLYINNRYGDVEDLGDYRVVGSKLSDVFGRISGLPINTYSTGHIRSFQDEKTKKVEHLLDLAGRARRDLPLSHTDIWRARSEGGKYYVHTVPEAHGFQAIRTSMKGLEQREEVTITDWRNAETQGIGKLIKKAAAAEEKLMR